MERGDGAFHTTPRTCATLQFVRLHAQVMHHNMIYSTNIAYVANCAKLHRLAPPVRPGCCRPPTGCPPPLLSPLWNLLRWQNRSMNRSGCGTVLRQSKLYVSPIGRTSIKQVMLTSSPPLDGVTFAGCQTQHPPYGKRQHNEAAYHYIFFRAIGCENTHKTKGYG